MKTQINIKDFDFGKSRLVKQISDDPQTGFARVIVFWDAEIKTRAEYIKIDADMVYINPKTNKILPNFTQPVLNGGETWIIQNDSQTVKIDSNFQPVENPNFDNNKDEGEDNQKYITQGAFNMYADLIFNTDKPIPLPHLIAVGIDNDDSHGYFN